METMRQLTQGAVIVYQLSSLWAGLVYQVHNDLISGWILSQ